MMMMASNNRKQGQPEYPVSPNSSCATFRKEEEEDDEGEWLYGEGTGKSSDNDGRKWNKYSSEKKDGCRLIFRFQRPESLYEKVVSALVTKMVHCDIVLDDPNTENKRFCFSAYMNEKFSMNLMSRQTILSRSFDNYSLDISRSDLERCSKFLMGIVDKGTPYNYSDAVILLPALSNVSKKRSSTNNSSGSSGIVETMIPDLKLGVRPADIKTVFCSQAAVLVCRECIRDTRALEPLVGELREVNSRLTSPSDLMQIMKRHGALEISNADFDWKNCDDHEHQSM